MQYKAEIDLSSMKDMSDMYFPVYSSLQHECVVDQVDFCSVLRDGVEVPK